MHKGWTLGERVNEAFDLLVLPLISSMASKSHFGSFGEGIHVGGLGKCLHDGG